jgi:hypothetical protein
LEPTTVDVAFISIRPSLQEILLTPKFAPCIVTSRKSRALFDSVHDGFFDLRRRLSSLPPSMFCMVGRFVDLRRWDAHSHHPVCDGFAQTRSRYWKPDDLSNRTKQNTMRHLRNRNSRGWLVDAHFQSRQADSESSVSTEQLATGSCCISCNRTDNLPLLFGASELLALLLWAACTLPAIRIVDDDRSLQRGGTITKSTGAHFHTFPSWTCSPLPLAWSRIVSGPYSMKKASVSASLLKACLIHAEYSSLRIPAAMLAQFVTIPASFSHVTFPMSSIHPQSHH